MGLLIPNEMSNLYRGPSIDASYQVSYHLAKRFQRKSCFRNWTIRNKNCLWWPCLEGSVLSFLRAEWKVSDTGSAQCWASSLQNILHLLFNIIHSGSMELFSITLFSSNVLSLKVRSDLDLILYRFFLLFYVRIVYNICWNYFLKHSIPLSWTHLYRELQVSAL
jgi:hypothetical protein